MNKYKAQFHQIIYLFKKNNSKVLVKFFPILVNIILESLLTINLLNF